jgi:hypothetical protein
MLTLLSGVTAQNIAIRIKAIGKQHAKIINSRIISFFIQIIV